jgi:hypothetical protein
MLSLLLAVAVQIGPQGMPAGCDDCTLRLKLASDKTTYEVGEPITLSVELTNTGRNGLVVAHTSDVTGRHDGYRFEAFDEAGHRIPDPGAAAVSLLEAIGGYVSIRPSDHDDRQFLLNYYVAPLKPGRYVVSGRFAAELVRRGLVVESNAIAIVVVPTPPARMRQRIAELIDRAGSDPAGAATFLGFTGHAAAIPPVVDLLYFKDDRVAAAAVDALLYFDPGAVRALLLEALSRRGPRDRMIHFLVVRLKAPPAAVQPNLIDALVSTDGEVRAAAVEGLRLSNAANDPRLFAPLSAMLKDPVAAVRQRTAAAVGQYADQRALEALRPAVEDPDPEVSEQATIAVGWVAVRAARDSDTRADAIAVLRAVADGERAGSSSQAKYWLSRVGSK